MQLKRDVLPALTEVRASARVRANPMPIPNPSPYPNPSPSPSPNQNRNPNPNQADVKLFAVGIGSRDAAREFADALDFPAELLLADESEDVLAHAAAGTRNTRP